MIPASVESVKSVGSRLTEKYKSSESSSKANILSRNEIIPTKLFVTDISFCQALPILPSCEYIPVPSPAEKYITSALETRKEAEHGTALTLKKAKPSVVLPFSSIK